MADLRDARAAVERFKAYDFDSDARFQAGRAKVMANVKDDADREREELRARLFYFSKFVQPLELSEYLAVQQAEAAQPSQAAAAPLPEADDGAGGGAAADAAAAAAATTAGDGYPRSFLELMQMVQRGDPIPGVKDIPNITTTLPPSKPSMTPRPKPWEVAAATASSSDATAQAQAQAQAS